MCLTDRGSEAFGGRYYREGYLGRVMRCHSVVLIDSRGYTVFVVAISANLCAWRMSQRSIQELISFSIGHREDVPSCKKKCLRH